MARNGILLATLLAVTLTGGCTRLISLGQKMDAAADKPVITEVPNICKVLTTNPETTGIVGAVHPPRQNDADPIGRHECTWPAGVNPLGAEIRVTIALGEERAEASARESFSDFVRRRTDKDRAFGLVRYGDFACVQSWNPPDVVHLGIMKEGNVLTVVSIQTRDTVAPQRLRALAGDVRGPVRTLLRVIDTAINRPPNLNSDPSGPIPKPPTAQQRDAQPDWNDRRCKEKLAPPVFNL
ncbi:hypothetical protein M8C13_26035 [Crossiella sp. SN42]|uniref:hypothetical protein n=1 Tax=Crossiella sp. SN42 TaxID=2944808 RepID=UPI00207C50A9|nr:hypothetical protein [Crossiella sp. SN42]MCO1579215.1 hypothetical protein [Crossiella sp. SN42]